MRKLSIYSYIRLCFNNLFFHLSSTVWDRWGQHGSSNSSHRVVVLCPPDVHVVLGHFLLEVAVLHGDVPRAEEQLQPHLDGVAPHGEALARQAQAGWKQISHSSRSGLFPVHTSQPLQHQAEL